MESSNSTVYILIGVIAIFIIACFSIIMAYSKNRQKLLQKSNNLPTTTERGPPTYDEIPSSTALLNPFLEDSQPSSQRSSIHDERAPLSREFTSTVIEIPPPSYQDHTKDLRLPKLN
ncbi:hypothetical protein BGW37DRAFT_524902 [Umbelopsis sp. PMI_123]|nr:hypothetical protein BGW37DRAFT_524902 [Umbelopsis sp. PMI_123]